MKGWMKLLTFYQEFERDGQPFVAMCRVPRYLRSRMVMQGWTHSTKGKYRRFIKDSANQPLKWAPGVVSGDGDR